MIGAFVYSLSHTENCIRARAQKSTAKHKITSHFDAAQIILKQRLPENDSACDPDENDRFLFHYSHYYYYYFHFCWCVGRSVCPCVRYFPWKKMLKLQIEGAVFWCVVINYISTISICEYEYTYVLRSCCPPELFIYSWYLRQCNLSHRTIIPVRMIKNTRIQITLRSISICIIWIEQLIYLRMKYIDANTTSICYRIYF